MPALFVSYSGVLGGAERFILDMAVGLAETPSLACPRGPLAERASEAGLHVIELPERSLELRASARHRVSAPLRLAAHARELRSLVRSVRPDAVVACGMRSLLACAALGHPRPPLVFQHDDLLPGPVIAWVVRAAAERANAVSVPSDCVARNLDPKGRLRARVIHPGVELERFHPSPPAGHPEVLVLGAVVSWKRPEFALEVAAVAARARPELRLRLAGEPLDAAGGRLLEKLRRRASQPDLAGRVEFAGHLDSADALSRATCLLHCAEREPFGIVLAEALAASRPVVAPRSCGPLEIVDESCGRLYPVSDPEAAARALVDVTQAATTLGEAGRRKAERLFDIKRARNEYRELLDGLPAANHRLPTAASLITLVTVTHNSEKDIDRLLNSASTHLPDASVVVVDSGSRDASVDVARRHGAHVIELEDNVGFGRASNSGVAVASAPVTVLVNPDIEFLDGSLAFLAHEARTQPDRILAPLVLLPDGSRQDSAQEEPASPAALGIALVPPILMPPPLRRAACPWTRNRAGRVGWAVGCCLVARTDTLRQLGPFDEGIFMYGEDLDLGLRANDASIETWFRPEARVLHHRGHSTMSAFGGEPFDLLAGRRRAVIRSRRGAARALADDALQLATFVDRVLLKTLARRDTSRERAQIRALFRSRRVGDR